MFSICCNLYIYANYIFGIYPTTDIEAQIREIQSKKKEVVVETESDKGVGLGESGYFDSEIYDGTTGKGKYEGYVTSIAANDEVDDEEYDVSSYSQNKRGSGYNAPAALLNDVVQVNIVCLISKF